MKNAAQNKKVRQALFAEDPALAAYRGVEDLEKEVQQLDIRQELTDEKINVIDIDLTKKITKIAQDLSEIELTPGPQGEAGPEGKEGPPGEIGPQGLKGDTGLVGLVGKPGKDGKDGADGSPDTPEQIADKLNTLEGVIEPTVIKNFPTFEEFLVKLKDPKYQLDISNIRNWNQPARGRQDLRWSGAGGGAVGGLVTVIHKDGTRTVYNADGDTDVLRGTALKSAVTEAVSGDTIYLADNTYDLGLDGYLDLPTNVAILGSGMYSTVIKADGSYSPVPPYAIVNLNDNTVLKDLTVWGTNTSGKFQYLIGNASSVTHGGENVLLENVKMIGDTDGLMFDNNLKVTMFCHNIETETKFDSINLQAGNGSVIVVYDSRLSSIGPSSTGAGIVRGIRCDSSVNTVYLYDTTVIAQNGGRELAPGLYDGYTSGLQNVSPNSSIKVYGGSVTVSSILSAFTPVYSLEIKDGELDVDSQVIYDVTLTSGTPTYSNATQNLANIENALSALTGTMVVTSGVISVVAGLGTVGTPLVITTAKLTALGTNGSMTFIQGILTAQTPAT